jgi:hypothetical protein
MSKRRILSLAAVAAALVLGGAPPAAAQAGSSDDAQAIAGYTLSMDKLTAFRDATLDLKKAVEGDAEMAARAEAWDQADDEHQTLTELAGRIESEPKLKAALASHGLTAREYMLVQLATVQAMMAESLLGMKQATLPAGVNPKNVEFVKAHKAELQELLGSLSGMGSQ